MLAFLAPFLGKIIAGLAMLAAMLAVYFGIKRKGTLEERRKWELAEAEAKARLATRVSDAISKDATIDARVDVEKKEIREKHETPETPPGDDIFKF